MSSIFMLLKIKRGIGLFYENNINMKDNFNKNLRARVSEEHLNMLHELKEKYYVNISQFMRNAIENEYNSRKNSEKNSEKNSDNE